MKPLQVITLFLVLTLYISCSNEELTQDQEAEKLENMLTVIEKLASTTTCEESSSWTFTAIGSKACGGPTAYIAYSTKIDTKSFLEKVNEYTLAQAKYNDKWNLYSDCSVPSQPTGVICQNGIPTFIY